MLFPPADSPAVAQTGQNKELTVFAAASLTEAFQTLGRSFEATHDSLTIRFNFGGSQQLVQQIIHGAKADLFAPAGMKQMNMAVGAGLVDSSLIRVFARNRLVVIVPKNNPAHVRELKDLATPKLKLVLADSSVPVGQYAIRFLERCSRTEGFASSFRKQVLGNVVSYEENVRAVLSKVRLDECDAGIVYSSDIARDSVHEISRIPIPDQLNIIAEYPLAVVSGSGNPKIAAQFLEYVLSDAGGRVLSQFGFMSVSHTEKR